MNYVEDKCKTAQTRSHLIVCFSTQTTRLLYQQRFFQLSLSVAYLFHELSLKCCLGVA